MEQVMSALASLFMYFNPVGVTCWLSPDRFIGFVQAGLFLAIAGLAAIALIRAGMSYRAGMAMALGIALMGVMYLFWHGGNPFGIAEGTCTIFGSLFRFIGGVGVAAGVVILIGIRHVRSIHPVCLYHPVVIAFVLLYGWLCIMSFGLNTALRSHQIWLVLSLVAVWLSYGGILGMVSHSLGAKAEPRPVALVAAGCIAMVLLTMVHPPFSEEYRILYAGSFPAGVFIGAVMVPALM